MSNREKLLDRLAKLLALESSPHAAEAATARRLAESLMQRHGLRREDAAAAEPRDHCEVSLGTRGWGQEWRFVLATAAARHCGAEALRARSGRDYEVKIVGARDDVGRATSLYADLLASVIGLGGEVESRMEGEVLFELEDFGPRRCIDAFRRGSVAGVISLLVRPRRASSAPPASGSENPRESTAFGRAIVRLSGLVRRPERSGRSWERHRSGHRQPLLSDVICTAWFELGARLAREKIVIPNEESRRS